MLALAPEARNAPVVGVGGAGVPDRERKQLCVVDNGGRMGSVEDPETLDKPLPSTNGWFCGTLNRTLNEMLSHYLAMDQSTIKTTFTDLNAVKTQLITLSTEVALFKSYLAVLGFQDIRTAVLAVVSSRIIGPCESLNGG